jgi:hypothetical protein
MLHVLFTLQLRYSGYYVYMYTTPALLYFTLLSLHVLRPRHATPRRQSRRHTHNADTHTTPTHTQRRHTHNAHTHNAHHTHNADNTYASFSMVSRALFKPTSYSLPDDESITNLTLSLAATVNR